MVSAFLISLPTDCRPHVPYTTDNLFLEEIGRAEIDVPIVVTKQLVSAPYAAEFAYKKAKWNCGAYPVFLPAISSRARSSVPAIYILHRHASKMGKALQSTKAKAKHPIDRSEKKKESKKTSRNPSTPKSLIDIPAQCLQHGFRERIMHTRSRCLASSSVWHPETGRVHVINMNSENYSSAVAALDEIYPHGELLPSSGSSYQDIMWYRLNTGRTTILEARTSHSDYMHTQDSSAYAPTINHLSPYGDLGFDRVNFQLQRFPTLFTECGPAWPTIPIPPPIEHVLEQVSTSLEPNMTTVNDAARFEYEEDIIPSGMLNPCIIEGGHPLPYYDQNPAPVVALYSDYTTYSMPSVLPNNIDSVNSYIYDQSYFPFDTQEHIMG